MKNKPEIKMYAGKLQDVKYISDGHGNAVTKFALSLSDTGTMNCGVVHFWIPQHYRSHQVVITASEKPKRIPRLKKRREYLIPGKLVRLPKPDAFGNAQVIERDETLPAMRASMTVVGNGRVIYNYRTRTYPAD
ncbi:MAG: hypothetical protein ABIG30_01860 [Candidatus Aenigmatarchaeota archaeon]